jgi:hypothetical protein
MPGSDRCEVLPRSLTITRTARTGSRRCGEGGLWEHVPLRTVAQNRTISALRHDGGGLSRAARIRQLTRTAVPRKSGRSRQCAVSRSRQRDPRGRPYWTAARAGARSSSKGERDARGALPRRLHAVQPMDLHLARSLTPATTQSRSRSTAAVSVKVGEAGPEALSTLSLPILRYRQSMVSHWGSHAERPVMGTFVSRAVGGLGPGHVRHIDRSAAP